MNKKVLVNIGIISSIMLTVLEVYADSSGFNFLKIGVGAKALSMGGAYSGLAEGKDAMYWNAAGLTDLKYSEMGTSYMDYVVGIKSGYVSYVLPVGAKSGIGIAVNFLDYGKMQETGTGGETLDDFSAYDLGYFIGYGRKLGSRLGVGVSVGMVKEKIKSYTAESILGDVGLKYTLIPDKLELGLVGKNIGTQTKAFIEEKSDLPTEYHLGLGYKVRENVSLGLEGVNDQDNTSLRAGAEYNWKETVSLRFGYNSLVGKDLKAGSSKDSMTGFSAGLGLEYRGMSVDYSYVPYNELGDVHRMSLGMKFGAGGVSRAAIKKKASKVTDDSESSYAGAVKYRKEGDYAGALKAIKVALRIENKEGRYWAEQGNIFAKIGETSKAIKSYEKAVILDPENETIRRNCEKLKKRISRL